MIPTTRRWWFWVSVRTVVRQVVRGDVVAACCWSDDERVIWLSFAEQWPEEGDEPQGEETGPAPPPRGRVHPGQGAGTMRLLVVGRRHRLGIVYGISGQQLTATQQALLSPLGNGRLPIEPLDVDPDHSNVMHREGSRHGTGEVPRPRFLASFRKPSGVKTARRRLHRALDEDGYPAELIQRVVVAAAEAMINAVRYAGGGRMRLYSRPRQLVVVVTDQGEGIPFDKLALTLLKRRDRTTVGRGHGYWLMVTLSSQCRVFSGPTGTRVELFFDLEERRDRGGG